MANWVKVKPDSAETTILNLELVAAIRMWDSIEMATVEFAGELRLSIPAEQAQKVAGLLSAHDCTTII
jgi:hypothetical protein